MSFKRFILMLLAVLMAIIVCATMLTIGLWLLAGIVKLVLTMFYFV